MGTTAQDVVKDLFLRFRDAQDARAKRRREEVELRATVDPLAIERAAKTIRRSDEELGVPIPSDRYIGCTRLRTLRTLLARVDAKGCVRTSQLHPSLPCASPIPCVLRRCVLVQI